MAGKENLFETVCLDYFSRTFSQGSLLHLFYFNYEYNRIAQTVKIKDPEVKEVTNKFGSEFETKLSLTFTFSVTRTSRRDSQR